MVSCSKSGSFHALDGAIEEHSQLSSYLKFGQIPPRVPVQDLLWKVRTDHLHPCIVERYSARAWRIIPPSCFAGSVNKVVYWRTPSNQCVSASTRRHCALSP